MVELSEELRMFQLTVRRYVQEELMPLEAYILREEPIPEEERARVEALGRELGLWKISLSEELGGAGLGLMGLMIVSEEMSKVLGGIGGTLYSSGPPPIGRNPEQMDRWFWPVLDGKMTWCFALTEEGGGSDPAGNMRTTAVRDGDNWVINGRKVFVTGGDTADFAVVFALTDKDKRQRGGINAFVVEKGTPGASVVRSIPTLGEVTPVVMEFENVVVPNLNRIGGEGTGYGTAQNALTSARVQIGARAIGIAERLLEMGIEYVKTRISFGKPTGERQAVQFMLADCAIEIHACRSMTYDVAWKADHGQDPRIWASIVKVYASEMVWNVADRILQIHGGWGYSKELPIERFLRIARLWRIAEGPNEVHRWVIGRALQREGIDLLRPVN